MSVENMRAAITGAYPGDRWRDRVRGMEDSQVIAIYNHFVRDGVFNRVRVEKSQNTKPEYRQQTLWDDYGISR